MLVVGIGGVYKQCTSGVWAKARPSGTGSCKLIECRTCVCVRPTHLWMATNNHTSNMRSMLVIGPVTPHRANQAETEHAAGDPDCNQHAEPTNMASSIGSAELCDDHVYTMWCHT